jgi:hypothetical protein
MARSLARSRRAIASAILLLGAAADVGACGGGAGDPVVVRVGDSAITKSALTRRISALAPGHEAPDPPHYSACITGRRALSLDAEASVLREECAQQYRALRNRALRSLISAAWLREEARERGVAPSRLQALFEGAPAVSRAEISRYYHRHVLRFERPEVREIAIVENLPSAAAARALKRRIESGASGAGLPLHESLQRPLDFAQLGEKQVTYGAIFAAAPRVLSNPTLLRGLYSLFKVTQITPASRQPLERVQRAIAQTLGAQRRRSALAHAVLVWRRRWSARTACSPGYVVQKCRGYRGAKTPEPATSIS